MHSFCPSSVILLFLIRSSKESPEKSGSSNTIRFSSYKLLLYRGFPHFSHCLFYFSEEQRLGKNKSISADNDFSTLRRYIFRRLTVFIKNVNRYKTGFTHINTTEKTLLLLSLLLSLFKSSAMYLCIHSFINVFLSSVHEEISELKKNLQDLKRNLSAFRDSSVGQNSSVLIREENSMM